MAIRITHGRVEDIGALAKEAGKGEQKVRQEAQNLERELTAANNSARIQAAQISANTAIQKAVMDAENTREMVQFQSFMRAESERRQIAWQTEKIEMGQRHDFDMNMQRKDIENQMIMEAKTRKDMETNQRKEALTKARENFEITDTQYKRELLNIEMGGRPGQTLGEEMSLEQMSQQQGYQAELAQERAEAKRTAPENVAMRTADLITQVVAEAKDLDPETQAEVQRIVKTPNISEMAVQGMLDTIAAKKQALAREKRLPLGQFAFGP